MFNRPECENTALFYQLKVSVHSLQTILCINCTVHCSTDLSLVAKRNLPVNRGFNTFTNKNSYKHRSKTTSYDKDRRGSGLVHIDCGERRSRHQRSRDCCRCRCCVNGAAVKVFRRIHRKSAHLLANPIDRKAIADTSLNGRKYRIRTGNTRRTKSDQNILFRC